MNVGEHSAWWALLILWPLVAWGGAVLVGRAIRLAERRRHRPD